MTTAADLIALAESQVGTPIPTDGVPYATKYSCAKFTAWVYAQLGMPHEDSDSPSVQMAWFDQRASRDNTPQVGDQIFIDLTGQGQQALHTGFVVAVHPDGTVTTVENNAGPDPTGFNGVAIHQRNGVGDGYTLGFGHPNYSIAPQVTNMNLYLGCGHGMEPNGVFDPGAHNDVDGTNEYDINFAVTTACDLALTRCGVTHYTETSAGRGHDVDYRGAIDAINAGHFDLAVELHYDSYTAPDDEFGIYVSDAGKRLADLIEARMRSVGQATKPSYKDVRGLAFIEATVCPALIVECGATHHREPAVTQLAGEVIAAAICDWYGVTYIPPAAASGPGTASPAAPVVTNFPGDNMKRIDFRVEGNGVGLDDKGNGFTLLTDAPWGNFLTAWANTAGYTDVPEFRGAQNEGGYARVQWKGTPNFPPFDAHAWTAD